MERTDHPESLRRDVDILATEPREAGGTALARMRDWVEGELRAMGWEVERDPLRSSGLRGINLIAEVSHTPRAPLLVVTAHLDTQPGTPGADDNASAVAALLALAGILREDASKSPIRLQLVVTDLEECGMLGAAHHADRIIAEGSSLRGMISLEMLGYCTATPGSQGMPPALVGLYPDTGDFIGIIGNERSAPFLAQVVESMRRTPDLKVESLAVPGNGETFPPTRLSDHSPFWDRGLPALMITDTSFFRNPHYHQATDTPETLDYEFLALVTQGTAAALRDLMRG
ncbi:M28 family peptidase [Candidatus Sumerlaeota bacterium]|nr:M28 family peptidase [Candidatus Sumerlaeota bacterium]